MVCVAFVLDSFRRPQIIRSWNSTVCLAFFIYYLHRHQVIDVLKVGNLFTFRSWLFTSTKLSYSQYMFSFTFVFNYLRRPPVVSSWKSRVCLDSILASSPPSSHPVLEVEGLFGLRFYSFRCSQVKVLKLDDLCGFHSWFFSPLSTHSDLKIDVWCGFLFYSSKS